MSSKELVASGNWQNGAQWEMYMSDDLPPTEKCTAAFCVAITGEDKIVLMQARRGWGMLGGHIEASDKNLEATAIREAQEEGGYMASDLHLFGYRKITSPEPILHQDGTSYYPFPESYIVYYWSKSDSQLVEPSGDEVLSSGSFDIEELRKIGNKAMPDLPVIEAGWQAYQTSLYHR